MTLEPCPFCGGKRPMVARYPADELGPAAFAVRCTRWSCVAQGPAEGTSDAAVALWNARSRREAEAARRKIERAKE